VSYSVCLITPAHGRPDLTNIILKQRRRMCDQLHREDGIHVDSIIIANDQNLDIAKTHGFQTIERDNTQLGRRFNDGIEAAYHQGFDYITPAGSDDLIHPDLLSSLPGDGSIHTPRCCTIIREDGLLAATLRISYEGAAGTRTYPRHIFDRVGPRPAADHKPHGCDTSILEHITHTLGPQRWAYIEDPHLVIAPKTGVQLNSFRNVAQSYAVAYHTNPWQQLHAWYPLDTERQLRRYYQAQRKAAA